MKDYVFYLTETASCLLYDSSMKTVSEEEQTPLLEMFCSPKKYRVNTNIKLIFNKWKLFNL
jgi:hypothetical protein